MSTLYKDNRGFTLIEIIIVIMGIIAIVAIPQFMSTIKTKRLYDAIEKLNDDINYCRDYAIAQPSLIPWVVLGGTLREI